MIKRKLIALITVCILLFSLISCGDINPQDSDEGSGENVDYDVVVKASKETAKVGETVLFNVSFKSIENVKSCGIRLIFDKDVFEFVNGNTALDGEINDFTDGIAVVAFKEAKTLEGNVITFNLKAKKEVNDSAVMCEASVLVGENQQKTLLTNVKSSVMNVVNH